jgi:hypothetical protein
MEKFQNIKTIFFGKSCVIKQKTKQIVSALLISIINSNDLESFVDHRDSQQTLQF